MDPCVALGEFFTVRSSPTGLLVQSHHPCLSLEEKTRVVGQTQFPILCKTASTRDPSQNGFNSTEDCESQGKIPQRGPLKTPELFYLDERKFCMSLTRDPPRNALVSTQVSRSPYWKDVSY